MELGGHAPVVVFDDVDVESVAELLLAGKVRNAGQVCVSPTRFYVQERIYDRFVDAFTALARSLPVGSGLDEATRMGPLGNPRRLAAMERLVGDATERGASLRSGGDRLGDEGFFWAPTVLTDVPGEARVMHEEPFGPLATVAPFADMAEAVHEANRLPYGLAAYAFTRSHERATVIGEALEAGAVGLNNLQASAAEAPFGGVKGSGYGVEGGVEGLAEYLNTKFISQT
jgi:succinate-semialdehyde dehydrogenase/glutarate-semialdehyde dehydrogenase